MSTEIVTVLENTPLREVIKFFMPQKCHLLFLLNSEMQYQGLISEIEVIDALLTHGIDYPVGKIKK